MDALHICRLVVAILPMGVLAGRPLTGLAHVERRSHGEGGKGKDDDGLDGNHFDCVEAEKDSEM